MHRFNQQTVLIVDDQPNNLQVLSDTLSAANLQVAVALDGESALEQTQHFQPDLILLDIMMPGMDGFETCQRILDNPKTHDVPILFMTALSDIDYKSRSFSMGAVDYITKPFQQQEVFARIQVHLRLRAMAQLLSARNRQLKVEAARAARANLVKSKFLANMSHELRTPLNGVMGYTQGLQISENLSDRELGWVNSIYECGSHLLRLIDDILDISKIEADKLELEPKRVSLSPFLTQLVQMFSLRAEEAKLDFLVELDPHLPDWISVDEKRLRQILINLLGNAFKFTRQGSVTLRVQQLSQAGDRPPATSHRLRFEIEDTGPGISQSHQTIIFEAFEQIPGLQNYSQGTGLGLSISKQILALMNSSIELRSDLGQGSQFAFELSLEAGGNQALLS